MGTMPWQIFKSCPFVMYDLKVYASLCGLSSETGMLSHEKREIPYLMSKNREEPFARAHLEGF